MAFRSSAGPVPDISTMYLDMSTDGPAIGTLIVIVDRAKNLPNKKTTKQDPYCQARLGKAFEKTRTDRRGGQTPKWDQELRFTVHDSPDYYSLKISIFNDDKKTDLIGDAWVDLKPVIVSGGGQRDLWQDLKLKGKYAGEVRIELTYYDTRPKEEKPVSVREVVDFEDSNLAGPREYTPKRRPLPANPASGPLTVDNAKQHVSGAREYGTQPHTHSLDNTPSHQRQKAFQDEASYTSDRRRTLPAGPDQYHNDYQHNNFTPLDSGAPFDQFDQYGQRDYNPHNQPYQDVNNFLPQLPPMTKSRGGSSLRGSFTASQNNLNQAYNQPLEQGNYYQNGSQFGNAPEPPKQDYNPYTPDPYGQNMRQISDNFDQESIASQQIFHPQPRRSFILDDQLTDLPQPVIENGWVGSEPTYTDEPAELEAPPPPPIHRRPVPQAHAHSSPGYMERSHDWDFHEDVRNDPWAVQAKNRLRGHLTSRSEITLPRFNDQESFPEFHQPRESHGFSNLSQLGFNDYDSRYNEQSMQVDRADLNYQPTHHGSFRDELAHTPSRPPYDPRQMTDDRRTSLKSHSSAESVSRMQYRPSPSFPPAVGSSSPIGPHSLNGSANVSPSRPHPLSQQHIPSSSPEHYSHHSSPSNYDPVPVIKPLAISPHKRMSLPPASIPDRRQSNYHIDQPLHNQNSPQVRRKEILSNSSPATPSSQKPFVPFSPESFDALNPDFKNVMPKTIYDTDVPIVDFHGNVIDPSDRLPEKSWAPEPHTDENDSNPDRLPRSSWASEPETSKKASEARRIRLQVRDSRAVKLNGARSMEFGALKSSPTTRFDVKGHSSPGETTSTVSMRNRLRKSANNAGRPQSVAVLPSWTQPISNIPPPPPTSVGNSSVDRYPPVPAKIPLHEKETSSAMSRYYASAGVRRDYERYDAFGGGGAANEMARLSAEMSSIDIGGMSSNAAGGARRIGGRRLLGYKN